MNNIRDIGYGTHTSKTVSKIKECIPSKFINKTNGNLFKDQDRVRTSVQVHRIEQSRIIGMAYLLAKGSLVFSFNLSMLGTLLHQDSPDRIIYLAQSLVLLNDTDLFCATSH